MSVSGETVTSSSASTDKNYLVKYKFECILNSDKKTKKHIPATVLLHNVSENENFVDSQSV